MTIKLTNNLRVYSLLLLIFIVLTSCTKDNSDQTTTTSFSNGVFISNEGLFNNGTGTISFAKRDGSEINHKIYQQANNSIPIGNILQSFNVINDLGFIMVNNANKVEVVDIENFNYIKTISNIPFPAYIIKVNSNKAYVSSWDDKLFVISINDLAVSGQISTGTGPTKMLKVENEVWVLNQGGMALDSTITIVDVNTDAVVQTLQVYPRPTGIQKDKNGNIWVMCSGGGNWHNKESEGHLVCLNPNNYSIIKDFEFPNITKHPEKLIINSDGEVLYYNYPGGIYKFDILNTELETTSFIPYNGIFYSLAYDQVGNVIYCSDVIDYVQNGLVFKYNASTGELLNSFHAGIVPGEFCFID